MRILLNGEEREAPPDITVAGLLRHFEMADRRCAVELNLEVVPRAELEQRKVHEGDQVEVVTLVGGG